MGTLDVGPRPVNMGGVVVLSVFAAVWAIMGLFLEGAPVLVWAVPAAMSLGTIIAGHSLSRDDPPVTAQEQQRIGRLIGIWSGVEGIAIFVAIQALVTLHREALVVATIALIVGLHFFPLARGIPLRLYYRTGALVTLFGLGGLIAPQVIAPAVIGFAAALVLWATLIGILWPARVAQRRASRG